MDDSGSHLISFFQEPIFLLIGRRHITCLGLYRPIMNQLQGNISGWLKKILFLFSTLVLCRPTLSCLIPTATTCIVSPPSSTWQPPSTSPRRKDSEFGHGTEAQTSSVSHHKRFLPPPALNRVRLCDGYLREYLKPCHSYLRVPCCSSRASGAVNQLKRFHEKKKQGLKPCSLYLDHIIRKSLSAHSRRDTHTRAHRDIYAIKVRGRRTADDGLLLDISFNV